MSTKQIPGPAGSLHIDDGGQGEIPIVFLHSFAGSSSHWSSQLMHLRQIRRAVSFDFRGHGESEPPTDNNYSIEGMGSDVAAVVDTLGIRKFVLVGHSMGGTVAVAYAASNPDRVEGLVLVGTPGKTPKQQAAQIMHLLESNYDNVMQEYWENLLRGAQPQVARQIKAEMGAMSREVSLQIIRAMFEFDPLPALRSYRNPKLAIGAAHGDSQNDLHHAVPDLPFREMTGTSHWMQMDRPGDFNLILDDFLGTLRASTIEGSGTTDEKIHRLLERLGQALSAADAKSAAACWTTPAMILSDEAASMFAKEKTIEEMFGKAVAWYRSQGIKSTKPEIERIEKLSEALVHVEVRWPGFDENGKEKTSERSYYIVHFEKDGEPRIQVGLTKKSTLLAA